MRPPDVGAIAARVRPLARAAAALGAGLLVVAAAAQVTSLWYQELARDGRIYVFNTPDRYRAFQASGEIGPAITLTGRGPAGETVVAENRTALDLFLFKHGLPAYDGPAPLPAPATAPALPQVKLGGVLFLSYQDGRSGGADYSKFVVKRGYVNVAAALAPGLSARVTPDVTLDTTTGETKLRLKFAYATFLAPRIGFLTRPYAQAGMAPTPWLEFEDRIDLYRMQDSMFLDRLGILASADVGVAVGGLLGGDVNPKLLEDVPGATPGRWGSFALGVFNGGGYAAAEKNTNKPIQGRLTVRPLPDGFPGLQLSGFGVAGKGNTAAAPDWTLAGCAASLESRWANALLTYARGRGNLAGTAVDAAGRALPFEAWSAFAEAKVSRAWSLVGRYDLDTPDTRAAGVRTARTIAGVARHLGHGADLLLDRDELRYEGAARPDDVRTQLTLQVKF